MDPNLLEILRTPGGKGLLELAGDQLVAPESGNSYAIRQGIAIFLDKAEGNNQKYQQMYDRLSVGYDLAEWIYYFFTRKQSYRKEFVEELEFKAGGRVLEVSIGTGANLRYVPKDVEVFGLDLSWGMLQRCARKIARQSSKATLVQGEGEALPFADASFDCVYHIGGINFFNDRAAAIHEMIRVARPGARIVISDETEKVVRDHYQRNPATKAYYEKGSEKVIAPLDLIPAEMQELKVREIAEGRLYCLSFRKPEQA